MKKLLLISLVIIFAVTMVLVSSGESKETTKYGGIFQIVLKSSPNRFGYPPTIISADRDMAPPFFDRLIAVGDDGSLIPELAVSWETSSDGKTITFKLRQGVKFHDGTDFNARAVKANFDKLIPPNPVVLAGVTSVEVSDDYTVKVNLSKYNNLILYQIASNYACYMYSPTALEQHDADWAAVNPVGTGPFMLKDIERGVSLTFTKNPNYWKEGLPYLDGMVINTVRDPMTQMTAIKAGRANAIYDCIVSSATQLKDDGYTVMIAPASLFALTFDAHNSQYFSKLKVRQALQYAIDSEAISSGPGAGLYKPAYQIVSSNSPEYNPACPPRKYDPNKAKQLLAEAGYPNGFSFKAIMAENVWKEGIEAAQAYLAQVGIKMEINYISNAAFATIRGKGQIEKGAAALATFEAVSNNLYVMERYYRSDSNYYQYFTRPAGSDALIAQAMSARDPAEAIKISQQINKLIYDDATVIPLYFKPRIVVLDKSVQDAGWFINGDSSNNKFGTYTWLKR